MLIDRSAELGSEIHVSTLPPLVRGPYETAGFRCPHGVDYWIAPTGEQIAEWVSTAPARGEFCHEHFSWLCQAGQGQCQRGETEVNPDEHNSDDPGCDSCGTCMACDGCADKDNPVDLARGDCLGCGACGPCVVDCAHRRALDIRPDQS